MIQDTQKRGSPRYVVLLAVRRRSVLLNIGVDFRTDIRINAGQICKLILVIVENLLVDVVRSDIQIVLRRTRNERRYLRASIRQRSTVGNLYLRVTAHILCGNSVQPVQTVAAVEHGNGELTALRRGRAFKSLSNSSASALLLPSLGG